MPPIDPERLLRTLSPLLDPQSGAIKSINEVDKLYGLMSKFSKKLVSKIIYINILKATPTDVLDQFMQRGGWDMICNWATEGLNNKNWPFLQFITELLLLTPTTVTRLKDNELPKIIKSLSKECENEEMRTAAYQVYEKWMGIAQQKEVPRYIGADGQSISLEDNLAEYELQQVPPSVSVVPDNQIILEADPTSGNFDLTQYIDATDLNNLETDFNPDDFNTTVEEHLMDGHELVDGDLLLHQDSMNSMMHIPPVLADETLNQLVSPMKLQSTDPNKAPLCIVVRDGKRFLLRLQVGNNTEEPVSQPLVSPAEGNKDAVVPERKIKSTGKPKMPPSGKPKMPTSGKPPLKAYEAKSKKVNTEDSNKLSKGIPNFYSKDKGKDKIEKDKEKERKARTKEKESEKKKQHSVMSASRAALEARRRIEEEKAEKLRLKVMEQKRVRDQRKEELAKKQKEIDDETLKALKLTAQPPTKIPKIPKKAPSFADMIAIPGATNNTEKEAKKISPTTKTVKDKEKDSTVQKDAKAEEDVNAGSRRSRPKVYNSGKSRSLGLLQEMEQAQAKGKEKEKEKEKPNVEDVDLLGVGAKKSTKRPSSENLESPAKKVKNEGIKKVVGIQESTLFMDTLNSVSTTRTTRSSKRKLSESRDKDPPILTPAITPPIKSPGADETKPVVFNFYRDTLGDNDENKAGEDDKRRASASTNEDVDDDKSADTPVDAFVPAEGEGRLKSNLVIHRPRNKPKKSVRWAEDAELKKFHYFEMDETERVNVTRVAKNFTEMKQIERSEERKVLKRNLTKDNMEEKIPWVTPRKIIFQTPPIETGTYSYEVGVQNERESCILEVVYFSKIQIPDSAQEPEEPPIKNQDDPSFLKPIPFDDIPGVTQSCNIVLKPAVVESRMNSIPPNPFSSEPKPNTANYLGNVNYQQPPQQLPPMEMAQAQAQAMQYNLWNTLSQVPNAAAAVAAAGLAASGPDMWNQLQMAGLQQAAAAASLGAGMPTFPLNLPFAYPPPTAATGFNAGNHPGMGQPPPVANHHTEQYGGAGNQNRFGGPPPHGRGGMGPRDNRNGRPNRWDDRGNYDERRRDGDRNRHNDRDRDNGRGGGSRGDRGGGGRDRDFHRTERNRAGTPRTVLCKFFQQGCCKVGEECDFLHPGINGPSRPSRFTSRFSSPPPSSSRGTGRTESPLKNSAVVADDDNWDAPTATATTNDRSSADNSFEHPPSSPTADDATASINAPRLIPTNESERMEF